MATATQLITAKQLLRMPDNGTRHELIDGVLHTMAPAGSSHGYVAHRLSRLLGNHVDAKELGAVFAAETGYLISTDPDTVRAPDVSFINKKRIPRKGIPDTYWRGAPDLAAEVLSPGDTSREIGEKIKQWLDAGTRLVWVVEPRLKTVTIYRSLTDIDVLSVNDTLEGEDVVPGFSCPVADIF